MKRRRFVTSVLAGSLATPVLAAGQHDHGEDVDGPLANVDVTFGSWTTTQTPSLDRFSNPPVTANVHKLIPFNAKIKAGGSVNFIVSGFHIVTVYGPGTKFEDVNGSIQAPLPG